MDGIREKFISSADKLGIGDALSGADAIVCALSGGADSCALLLLLKECYANAEIRAFHVNHMIRGEEADRDEEHCRALCGRLGVPFAVKKTDVPAMAEKLSLGLEEAARTARYSAFDEYRNSLLAEGKKDVLFATAHNADDNLETLIFNLIRGSGTHGLSGIAPRRGYIVRPMLPLSSEEIRNFMRSRGESFVTDSTNADTSYTRNKIRTQVIPILRTVSPACERAAYSASLLVRRDDEYLFSEAQKAAGGRTSAPVSDIAALPDPVLSRAVMLMYSEARGGRTDLRSSQVEECMRLIREGKRSEVSLPAGVSMYISDGNIAFAPTEKKETAPFCEKLVFSGGCDFFDFPEQGFAIALSDPYLPCPISPPGKNIYKISIHTSINFDKINEAIFIRNRLPGDKIVSGKMTKKVKKLLNAAHAADRDSIPVFCDADGIFYIPGIAVRDGMKEGSGKSVRISYWK